MFGIFSQRDTIQLSSLLNFLRWHSEIFSNFQKPAPFVKNFSGFFLREHARLSSQVRETSRKFIRVFLASRLRMFGKIMVTNFKNFQK
jgi:hypothetical protein